MVYGMRKYTPIARKKSVGILMGISGGRRSFHSMLSSTGTRYSRLHVIGGNQAYNGWHTIHWLGGKSRDKYPTHLYSSGT